MAFPLGGGVVTGSADLVAADRQIGDWTYCGGEPVDQIYIRVILTSKFIRVN
jgi:hypothetical protein